MPLTTPARPIALALLLGLCVLAAAPAAVAGAAVDESALRYYAAHNEPERLAAEIRRLKSLYPDWEPPTDFSAPADREGPLWALYAADDMDGLAKAIAALTAADPTFAPSPDLAAKIAAKALRRDLIAASDRKDAAAVLALAAANPGLGGCADADVAWRIAEARLAAGDRAGTEADFRRFLTECDNPGERRATIEKTLGFLGVDAARDLARLARTPDEFDALKPAFGRAAIAAVLADPGAPAPDPAEVAAFEQAALAAATGEDAAMLGWWRRATGDHAAALAAFEAAATRQGSALDAKVVEGIVLSLADLDRRAEAVRVARDGRDRSDAIATLYVDLGAALFEGKPRPDIAAVELSAYGDAVERIRSAMGAETLGWYAYDRGDPATARSRFEQALSWTPGESAARGALLAAFAAKDRPGLDALRARWQPDYPALADLVLERGGKAPGRPSKDPILTAFERGDFRGCAAKASARGKLKADQSLAYGWCLLKLGRPVEAAAAFKAADRAGGKIGADAAYGRSLALIASGKVEDAARVADGGVAAPARRTEIGAAVLADRAAARFAAKDWRGTLQALDQRAAFVAEPSDLALMRGWSLWHLGQRGAARAQFEALDRTLSTRATRQALAVATGS